MNDSDIYPVDTRIYGGNLEAEKWRPNKASVGKESGVLPVWLVPVAPFRRRKTASWQSIAYANVLSTICGKLRRNSRPHLSDEAKAWALDTQMQQGLPNLWI